jgi:outer membrane protein assembly factor BamE (lipoprotein component of BamABCDE complex)
MEKNKRHLMIIAFLAMSMSSGSLCAITLSPGTHNIDVEAGTNPSLNISGDPKTSVWVAPWGATSLYDGITLSAPGGYSKVIGTNGTTEVHVRFIQGDISVSVSGNTATISGIHPHFSTGGGWNELMGIGSGTTSYSVSGSGTQSYTLKVWDSQGSESSQTVIVPFEAPTTHKITASAGANGTISPNGEVSVTNGGNQTFTFSPNSGYEVDKVTVDGSVVSAGSSYAFNNVTTNHTISVTFKQTPVTTHKITASAGANGTISPSGEVSVTNGGGQTFTFSPNSGYEVDKVTVDGSVVSAGSSYAFNNVTTNHTISVTFKQTSVTTHKITASAGANGTISPNGEVSVTNGGSQTFTFSPNSGYEVDKVTVDGSVVSASSYAFNNVTTNHTISVTFKHTSVTTHKITASAGANGTISPSGEVSVTNGGNQTFTFSPNSGYEVDKVTVDGSVVSAGSSYVFNNVTTNHTISVTFKQNDTANEAVNAPKLVVYQEGFTLVVKSDVVMTSVQVFSISGQLVYKLAAKVQEMRISLPSVKGLLLVKVQKGNEGENVKKVLFK